jgi:flagellar biosynthesis/type III secretory pathway protein FliH
VKGDEQGIAKGLEKGNEQGIEKGIEQGISLGVKKSQTELLELMDQGYTLEQLREQLIATIGTAP